MSEARARAAAFAPDFPLPRGLGRSYGDASLPAPGTDFLGTESLDRFLAFDPSTGILEAEAGISLQTILKTLLPRGFFLPVTPGTQWVTLGGAVASNVHGKNHHHVGSIERFVTFLEVATPLGTLRCSPTERPDLFRATVGGYGLTGLITRIGLKMKSVTSDKIVGRAVRGRSLGEIFEALRREDGATYSVAWIDTLARGRAMGRGLLLVGEHAEAPRAKTAEKTAGPLLDVPFAMPSWLLRPWALRLFNEAYYRLPRSANEHLAGYEGYFYPLDAIGRWNRLYGPQGFFQYQFVIPDTAGDAERGVEKCLRFLADNGLGSFLAVLKRCGDDTVMLPFCKRGYTLALDIPHRGAETLRALEALDRQVLECGGRIYLTKDARLPRDTFRAMYPEWTDWMRVVRQYNPRGLGRSALSERLGLWE